MRQTTEPPAQEARRERRTLLWLLLAVATFAWHGAPARANVATAQKAQAMRYYVGFFGYDTTLCIEWPDKRTSPNVSGRAWSLQIIGDGRYSAGPLSYRAKVSPQGLITLTLQWVGTNETVTGTGDGVSLRFRSRTTGGVFTLARTTYPDCARQTTAPRPASPPPTAAPAPPPTVPGIPGDGQYFVGTQVLAGTYQSPGGRNGSICSASGYDANGKILSYTSNPGPVILVVLPSFTYVDIRGCYAFQRVQ